MQGKIALEEHFVTADMLDTLPGSVGWDPEEWRVLQARLTESEEVRLGEMDAAGVEISVLSQGAPGIQDLYDARHAVERAKRSNDALAEVVASHPDRYLGFAALPLQDPAAAADELERTVTELGFRGALVNGWSSVGDLDTPVYYDEPRYLEFWERVASLGVPIYLHPRNPLPSARHLYRGREELLGPTWAFTVETATHALRLMTSGLFDRHPSLTIVLGHLGELLPFAVHRTSERLAHVPGLRLERTATEYLRENFYVTTSGNLHTLSLLGAIEILGADRVLFSVDYPFEESVEAAGWFDAVPIDEKTRSMIGRENAARLLGFPNEPADTGGEAA